MIIITIGLGTAQGCELKPLNPNNAYPNNTPAVAQTFISQTPPAQETKIENPQTCTELLKNTTELYNRNEYIPPTLYGVIKYFNPNCSDENNCDGENNCNGENRREEQAIEAINILEGPICQFDEQLLDNRRPPLNGSNSNQEAAGRICRAHWGVYALVEAIDDIILDALKCYKAAEDRRGMDQGDLGRVYRLQKIAQETHDDVEAALRMCPDFLRIVEEKVKINKSK